MTLEIQKIIMDVTKQRKGGAKVTYNYSKLIGRIAEKGFTRESLSENVGISPMALYNKLHSKSYFNQLEIDKIAELLDIESAEIPFYFFVQ